MREMLCKLIFPRVHKKYKVKYYDALEELGEVKRKLEKEFQRSEYMLIHNRKLSELFLADNIVLSDMQKKVTGDGYIYTVMDFKDGLKMKLDYIKVYDFEGRDGPILTMMPSERLERETNLIGFKSIHIDDITIAEVSTNNGYGSMAMKTLMKYARINNFDLITGALSNADWNHKERQNHYYRKFGFKINRNEEEKKGHIKLELREH